MKKGEVTFMKYLKIEENKGYYLSSDGDHKEIDKINKEGLMYLLNQATEEDDFEMDEYQEENIGNPAHKIIYQNIYEKFNGLLSDKNRFKDESNQLYRSALEKYSEVE